MIDRTGLLGLCPTCGARRPRDNRFCPWCGASVGPADDAVAEGDRAAPAAVAPPTVPAPPPSRLPGLARLLVLLVAVGGALTLWAIVVGDDVPGFRTVLDFKVSLATLVLLLAVLQPAAAAAFYGWLRVPGISGDAAAFVHRWTGRVLLLAAALVAFYCVKDIGPQSSPTRVALHTALGSAVFVVLAAKLLILRGIPRLQGLLPVLGFGLSLLFAGLWFTSAFYVLRTRAQGYSGADVGAIVAIVDVPTAVGRFAPGQVRLRVGQAVLWRNQADATHNVVRVGGGFDSGALAPGGSFRWPAKAAGTFSYRCTIHAQMTVATIVVADE
jgi:plastocyanin